MPQRFLKPGLTSSRKWEKCTWQAQSFYVRLLTLVDDYGRYDADPVLLRSHAFPLREDIRVETIDKLSEETSLAQLVIYYQFSGKRYLQLTNWSERARSSHSYYPSPESLGVEILFGGNCESLRVSQNGGDSHSSAAVRCGAQLPESPPKSSSSPSPFEHFWRAYPKRLGKGAAEKAFDKACGKGTAALEVLPKLLKAIDAQRKTPQWLKDGGQYIPYPATWLNQRRWEDDVQTGLALAGSGRKLNQDWKAQLG